MNRGHGPNESTTNLGGARKFSPPHPHPPIAMDNIQTQSSARDSYPFEMGKVL